MNNELTAAGDVMSDEEKIRIAIRAINNINHENRQFIYGLKMSALHSLWALRDFVDSIEPRLNGPLIRVLASEEE